VVGESITLRAAGNIELSGVVKEVTPMRLLMETDGITITIPNKVSRAAVQGCSGSSSSRLPPCTPGLWAAGAGAEVAMPPFYPPLPHNQTSSLHSHTNLDNPSQMVSDMIIINRSRTSATPRGFVHGSSQLKFKLRLERSKLGDMNLLRNSVTRCLLGREDVVAARSVHCDAFRLTDKDVEMAVRVSGLRAGLGWAGLGWAGLGWAGLGWAGLGWAGLGSWGLSLQG
jgi:hypothetical protein